MKGQLDAVARNLSPSNGKSQRFRGAFAQHLHVHRSSLRAAQAFCHFIRGQPFGGLAVDFVDEVAGPQSGAAGR